MAEPDPLMTRMAEGIALRERGQRIEARALFEQMWQEIGGNLGECYRKLGQLNLARQHLDLGRASLDALGDDGYAQMIGDGLDRLADRLEA